MKKPHIAVREGLTFCGCLILTASIAYFLFDAQSALWAAIGCIYAFNLFNSQKEFKNTLYTGIGLLLIISSAMIGHFLTLKMPFFVALIVFSFFYYQAYGRDPMLDLTMKFMILSATIAATLPSINVLSLCGFLTGSAITTLSCFFLSQKKYLPLHFQSALFDRSLLKLKTHLVLRAATYSCGLALTLFLPLFFEIGHFYWTLLTYIFVLHPKTVAVIQVTRQRIWGCFLSVLMLFILIQFNFSVALFVALILISAFLLPFSNRCSYTFLTFVTTTLILSILELISYQKSFQSALLYERILETILGGAIAIVISFLLKRFRAP